MAGMTKTPWPDLWKGLPAKADDTAVAEHALRYLARVARPTKPWTKTDMVGYANGVVASRWWTHPGDIHARARADIAIRWAWDRLVGAGTIVWVKGKPLTFNLP